MSRATKALLAVSDDHARARAELAGLGDAVHVRYASLEAALGDAQRLLVPLSDGRGALWLDRGLADPVTFASLALDRGVPVVLADASSLDADALVRLASLSGDRSTPLLIGGGGVHTISFATLLSLLRSGDLGELQRVALRAPCGRRRLPAADTRNAFGSDGSLSWALDEEAQRRLRRFCAPMHRLLEEVVPGALAVLAPTEVIAREGACRWSAHGRVDRISLMVELDEAMVGEGPMELEVVGTRGRLIARWQADGRDVLLHGRDDGQLSDVEGRWRPPGELAVRHLLSPEPRLGAAGQAAAAWQTTSALLRKAEQLRCARPVDLVLVHMPRFRHDSDALNIPPMAVARLAAFARGHGFVTRVVDLAASLDAKQLAVFTDDEAVSHHIAGTANPTMVRVIDGLWEELSSKVSERSLVGFSVVDYYGHLQTNLAACLALRVKGETGRPVVLGGERDQVDGGRVFAASMPFDYVVEGDGEHALLGLLHLVAYDDRRPWEIDGVWCRRPASGKSRVHRGRAVRSHLNGMPRPDYDGMGLESYRRGPSQALLAALSRDGLAQDGAVEPFLYLPYGFVRGCSASCTFCSAKESLDIQSVDKSVDELLALSERHGVRDFVFLNNLSNFSNAWLERFCRRLSDSGADLQWTDSCRPKHLDPDLCALMRASGCLLLNYGAESGSDRVLERMNKSLSREDIITSMSNAHAAGIFNRINLIAGYFHETPEDVDLTIELVEHLAEAIDIVGCFQGFYLFPGMGVVPEAHGIVLRDGADRLLTGQVTLAYDEVDGLSWEDKRAAIDDSRNRVLAKMHELGIRTVDKIDEYDLFYLSRRFQDKATVARYLLGAPSGQSATTPAPGGQRGRVPVG